MKRAIYLSFFLSISVLLQAKDSETVDLTGGSLMKETPFLQIYYTSQPPIIDGFIDDVVDPWRQFVDLSVRNPNSTTSGMTGKFNILVGSDSFYLALIIQDATANSDTTAIPNSFGRDCTEIYFAMDTVTEKNGAYKAGCWQIRTQREGVFLNDGNSGANTWSIATLTNSSGFKVASVTSATEYIQEFVLPLSVLTEGMGKGWDKKFFRFDMAVADNTTGAPGGRTEQRFWCGNNGLGDDQGWNNTKSFGIVSLPVVCNSKLSKERANLRIFPNPVMDIFHIDKLKDIATICLTDLNGKVLLTKQVSGNEPIPVGSLSPGLYFIKIITDEGIVKMKMVKG